MKTKQTPKQSMVSKIGHAFDRIEKREQYLVMVAVPVTIIAVIFLLYIEPQFNKAKRLSASLDMLQNQLDLASQSSQELMEQAQLDPNLALKQQISSLEARLETLNKKFDGELNQLVTPQAMPGLLEELFDKANGLSLVSMKSVAPVPIQLNQEAQASTQQQTTPAQQDPQSIYRHGIEITFEGSFFDTRDFLAKAENLPWKLYWQDLSYSVSEHPKAVTQLTLFTLSTSEAFIGVY